ncbi:MAG: multidrug efflux pump subunit AcrB [Desulforhopalus sp.]|jgi:multidrug efflux pump subunit AcrB
MEKLVLFTLKQRVVMNLLFVLLIVVGAFTLLEVSVDRYPNIHFGKMYINTYLPGGSPEEVETLVTQKIEESLQEIDHIEYIRSSSYRERSNIVIKFIDDSDYEKTYNDVRINVLSKAKNLPERAESPVFNFLDVGDWFPTVSVNVSGAHTNTTLKLVAEEIKIPLSAIDGVSRVKMLGEYTREFHLLLDALKMESYGLTFQEITTVLQHANISIPAGHALTGGGEFTIRVDEQFTSRQEVMETILRTDEDGSFIRIADIVDDAFHTYQEPHIVASINGEECVTLQVLKSENGNALKIATEVRKLVDELRFVYGKDNVHLTVSQDSSIRIKDSIRVLGVNLMVGIILVCIIIWLFMGFRNAALTTIGIPFAFLVTLIFMYVTGNSINEVSLFAFILVSGIIVDDAIVVVENIYRHVQQGEPIKKAIVVGTSEVFLPVVSATLTTAAAFLPMLLMTGMIGDFFSIIPKTIVFALVASLLECLFILPCHYLEFGRREENREPEELKRHPLSQVKEAVPMRITRRLCNKLILFTLKFRYTSQILLIMVFLVAAIIFTLSFQGKSNLIRIQFFPDNYSVFYVEVFGPAGTPISLTNDVITKFSQVLDDDGPAMAESVLGFSGFYIDDDFAPQYGSTMGHIAVTLPPVGKRHFADYPKNDVVQHLDDIKNRLALHLPEQFTMVIRPEKDGPPTGKDITIRVLGTNNDNVELLAEKVRSFLASHESIGPWLSGLKDDQGKVSKIFRIHVLKEKVAELGLQVDQVAGLAASVVNGQIVGTMKRSDEEIDIIVKIAQPEQLELAQTLEIPIIDSPGGIIRLRDLCTYDYSVESGILSRFQQQRSITLTTDIDSGTSLTPAMIVNKTKEYYQGIRKQYPGATLTFAGEHESTQKSFLSLTYAFVVATILIYLILAAQFQSYLQPLIIISAVIFALLGVIFGTFLARTLFTINSFVAVLGVTGVVVNDSLVLVAFINSCYRSGMGRREALLTAANTRLRPIILTTLTTTLGLLPMALGFPEYSIVWGSMAMTFVTGLCTATVLTIIIVPAQWDIIMDLTESRNAIKEAKNRQHG